MISSILEQEEAIRNVLSADRKTSHLVPTWQDIDVRQSLHLALSLSDLTDILSAEKYVTVSAILPLMDLLNSKFLKEREEDTQLTADIKEKIRTDLNTRLSSYNSHQLLLLQAACFLDPQFKGKCLEDDDVENVKVHLLSLLDDPAEITASQPSSIDLQSSSSADCAEPPLKKGNLGTLFKNDDQESENTNSQTSQPSISTHEQFQREFLSYVTIPRLDFEENPLDWWKAHSSTYPSLAVFAKRFLCICATSSPSGHLFSSSGHIVSPVRMKLKPDKVNMLTFPSKNLD